MEVSNAAKSAYMGDGKTKYITVEFPELNISLQTGDGHIYADSMSLSEGLVDTNSIEFVGCISSKFKLNVNGINEEIKGKKIAVKIHTEGTENESIPLFKGIIDSSSAKSNKRVREITAYDELYTKGNIDVAAWYKALDFPVTLKQIRDSLFEYVGITQVEIDLPNDDIIINRKYNPNAMQSLIVIKSICQINGVFGIINRNGLFEYRILGEIESDSSSEFYPSEEAIGFKNINTTEFSFYKDVDFEKYTVKPVDKITIRQSEDDEGVTYGSGTNNYIIQGNMFAYGLSKDVLTQIAANIYPNVQGFSYVPFTSVNNGLPYLECGLDVVSYQMIDFDATEESGEIVYKKHSFYILNRELTGIQALKDSYSAQGEEYQTEFITDLQTQIDALKKNIKQEIEDNTYTKEEIDDKIAASGGWNVESVPVLPVTIAANTIYLIQGEVVVE